MIVQISKEIIANRNVSDEKHKELVHLKCEKFERAIFGFNTLGISKVYIDQDQSRWRTPAYG